jgi:hypothetical protein
MASTSTYELLSSPGTEVKKKVYNRIWVPVIALAATLYLMYSTVFLTDYLVNDEWFYIGSRSGLRESAKGAFFFWGRALFGVYETLVYRFAGYDPLRIQIVRFVNFASLVAIALLLFLFLTKKSENRWFSFFVILVLFSTASIQELMAYSLQLISNTQPAMWFSLLAFYVFFLVDDCRFGKSLRWGAAFLLLILALQSTQTFAFFCMVPLTYLTLCDWKSQRRKIFEFLALALLAFLVSTVTYRAGLHYWHSQGMHGYKLGEQAIEAEGQHPLQVLLHAANPLTYWSAFEIWSFPFPLHALFLGMKIKVGIALCLMSAWVAILAWTLFIEGKEAVLKWLAVLVHLGFGAIFIIADSPLVTIEHRPHMVLTFVGVAILSAAYCLQVLARTYPALGGRVAIVLGIVLVFLIALAAQAGTLRGYVVDRMRLLDFIRAEVAAEDPSKYRNIVVILPESHGPEPREFWVGRGFQDRYHMTCEGEYRYALATVGIPPESKTITFVEGQANEIPTGSVVIDWRKYLLSRQTQR